MTGNFLGSGDMVEGFPYQRDPRRNGTALL